MKKPSKRNKIDKKFEKRSTINCKIGKNDIDFSNCTNQNSRILESTFSQNVKSGRNNSNALNDHRKEITVKRSKRSSDKKPNYVGFKEQIPLSRRLYRHPKLSYEEQEKKHAFRNEGTIKPLFEELNSYVSVSSDDNEYFEMQKNLGNDNNTKDSREFDDIKIKKNIMNEDSIKRESRENYINIQDHQRDVNDTTSLDILDYDPNKIPYVEVSDYSDIREESLDEKDRRRKEGKSDFIDRETSKTNYDNSEEKSVRDSLKGKGNLIEGLNDSNFTNFKTNIKELENENKSERSDDFEEEFVSFERLKSDKFEEDKEEKRLNVARNGNNNLNNSNVDEGENGEPRGEDPEEDTGSESGPIIFDINEYRKPFDLDEFLKDNPIMKKLKLLEKETRAKYGQSGKRVSADFNESESDNAFRERADGQRNSADTFDRLSKSHRSTDSIFRKAKEGIKNPEDSNEEDERFVSKEEKENDPLPGFESEEKPLRRYFTEGAIRNLKGDTYEALSAILGRKSRVSRLNGDVDERMEAGDEEGYKNFWPLEYKSPRVDMEAQERRK